MPNVLIRGIAPEVLQLLKDRARRHRRSLQAELKSVLEEAAHGSMARTRDEAARLRAAFTAPLTDSVDLIREDRDR